MTNGRTPDQWEAGDLIDGIQEHADKTTEQVLEDHGRALIWIIRRMDLSTRGKVVKYISVGLGLGLAGIIGRLSQALL